MASKMGIVYDTQTKAILRVIQPDTDEQLATVNWCGENESIKIIDMVQFNSADELAKFIEDNS